MIKLLYVHENKNDYLAEMLFHGLRSVLGKNCVDIPFYKHMYAPLAQDSIRHIRGNAFTLYGLLDVIPELHETRLQWESQVDKFDIIVFTNIYTQWKILDDLRTRVSIKKMVIIDSGDGARIFPNDSFFDSVLRNPFLFYRAMRLKDIKYFKRELIDTLHYEYDKNAIDTMMRFLPYKLRGNIFPISFAIPAEKIHKVPIRDKTKDFTKEIVDKDLLHITHSSSYRETGNNCYTYASENEYVNDLKASRFGITTKRSGWDCLRHYELAANGCVLCFKDLDRKPPTCAPHGLDKNNCIIYHTSTDLKKQLDALDETDYIKLQDASYRWIQTHTTESLAHRFLDNCLAAVDDSSTDH